MANRHSNNLTSSISVLAITISLVAGQSVTQKSLAQNANSPAPAGVTSINGTGASTVNTLFVGTGTTAPFAPQGSWFNVFGIGNPSSLNAPAGSANGPVNTGFTLRYAPIGSGGGLRTLLSQDPPVPPSGTPALNNLTILRPVSFATVDDPLLGTEAAAIANAAAGRPNSGNIIQVPVIGVGIALAYNRTGLTIPAAGLRFSRPTYCAIANGTLTNWNDIRIRNDNGGALIAANRPLRFVRRSDSSGSTFVFSTHLNTVCRAAATPGIPAASVWNRGAGNISVAGNVPPAPAADTVVWPAGFLSASGGGGVASAITANAGAIGYVDSANRAARSLPAAVLRNRAGSFVAISSTSISEALLGGTIVRYGVNPTNRLVRIDNVVDPTRVGAYPISTASYMLFYDRYANTNVASGIRAFINWALANATQPGPVSPTADAIAVARGYAPLPNNIKTVSRAVVNTCVNTVVGPSPCN